jgi:hypothetical protein
MKCVYVLASSVNDTYYEQFFLSAVSLRLYNPASEIIVLVDAKTNGSLTDKRAGFKKYVSETKVISVPPEFSQKEASRWIKTSIHHYVTGDFLFIDCDTIITGNLTPDFTADVQIGAVLDTHVTLDRHHICDNFQKEDIKAGFVSSLKTNIRYNGGLIFCKDDTPARNFFEKWHSLWLEGRKRGCTQDMPSLNQANFELGNIITELDGSWNCQISHNGLPFLSNAKIIHYYATSLISFEPAYIPASTKILSLIKETGELPAEIFKLLENPKSAFTEKSRIIADTVCLDIIDSAYFSKLLWLRKSHKKLFFFLNKFLLRVKKVRFKNR